MNQMSWILSKLCITYWYLQHLNALTHLISTTFYFQPSVEAKEVYKQFYLTMFNLLCCKIQL